MSTPALDQRRFVLGTFSSGDDRAFPAIVVDDRVTAIARLEPLCRAAGVALSRCDTMLGLFEDWDTNIRALKTVVDSTDGSARFDSIAQQSGIPVGELKCHAPVMPRQIFCCGANYRKHVIEYVVETREATPTEMRDDAAARRRYATELMDRRARNGRPYAFTKPVTALNGPFDPITLPDYTEKVDWELELAVVMGRPAHRITRAQAMDHVAGFTIANDISARDQIFRRDEMAAMGTDWVASKSAPGFLPLGPYLVPAEFVDDIGALRLTLRLNGQVMQDEYAADMIFDVARQVEYLSQYVQLLPGDVICTGSPAGNAMSHGHRYLRDGDVLEGTITGCGTQRNSCVRAT
jgi:2,4-didehydro-3-deoxy-L-rhamnonate hydrolase